MDPTYSRPNSVCSMEINGLVGNTSISQSQPSSLEYQAAGTDLNQSNVNYHQSYVGYATQPAGYSTAQPTSQYYNSAYFGDGKQHSTGQYGYYPQYLNNSLDTSMLQHNQTMNASLNHSFNTLIPQNYSMINNPMTAGPNIRGSMSCIPSGMPAMPGNMPTGIPAMPAAMSAMLNDASYANMNPQMREFFISYTQWCNEYYKWHTMKSNPGQRRTPHKFSLNHSRVSFGCNNQLITVCGKSVIVHKLKNELIEAAEETLINTWPGPLKKGASNAEDILEYIKAQERCSTSSVLPEHYYLNFEKRQLWQLLAMMVKQAGRVTSSELAEFIISHNEIEFGSDKDELDKFRRFLLLGQKKMAQDFARKCGLWGHRFALAYLASKPQFNEALVSSVNDFIDATLSKEDPIFTLYRCLLQQLQRPDDSLVGNMVPPSNISQFTILLANGCEVHPTIAGSAFNSEVLKLIVALRNHEFHLIDLNNSINYLLHNSLKPNPTIYSEEMLFINEIYEFACEFTLPLVQIIPFKTIFACKLYDYGLHSQAKSYCEQIRSVYLAEPWSNSILAEASQSINWDLVIYLVDSIENRLEKNNCFPQIEYAYTESVVSSRGPSALATDATYEDEEDEDERVESRLESLTLEPSPVKQLPSTTLPNQPTNSQTYMAPPLSRTNTQSFRHQTAPLSFSNKTSASQSRPSSRTGLKAPEQLESQVSSELHSGPPQMELPKAKTKPKEISKTNTPAMNFFVPAPVELSSAPFDFVSTVPSVNEPQPQETNEPISNTNHPNAHNLPAKNQAPMSSLNSTTNGLAPNPAYMFSPAMSPISSPDPASFYRSDQHTEVADQAAQFQAASSHQTTHPSSKPMSALDSAGDQQSNDAANDKTKGLFTSLNSW